MAQKNWFQRHWKWAVPCGCVTLVVMTALMAVVIFAGVRSMMVASEPYKQAMERARTDPRVTDTLGTPIQTGWFIAGSINVTPSDGQANLNIPIEGPMNKGTLRVDASKRNGVWNMNYLGFTCDGNTLTLESNRQINRE